MNRFPEPIEVSGDLMVRRQGELTGPQACVIDAINDQEAVESWLRARASGSTHTLAAYRKEAYRLLDWMKIQRLRFATLNLNQVENYYAWLNQPVYPLKKQYGPRLSAPLKAGISPAGINYARRVIAQLFNFLVSAGYLKNNVFSISAKQPAIIKTQQTRYLTLKAWQYFWGYLVKPKPVFGEQFYLAERNRWMIALLYHSGIRRENLVNGVMGDFVMRDDGWTLRIIGKGKKELFSTINNELLSELMRFRCSLGLNLLPTADEATPLLPKVRGGLTSGAMSLRNVGHIVKQLTSDAVRECEDASIRAQLQAMTTHWLRHTNGTHRLMAGASLESTSQEFGHADLKTTLIYAKATNSQLREGVERLAALAKP